MLKGESKGEEGGFSLKVAEYKLPLLGCRGMGMRRWEKQQHVVQESK